MLPKVSPNLADAGAMTEAKRVDAGPSGTEGGYSPMRGASASTDRAGDEARVPGRGGKRSATCSDLDHLAGTWSREEAAEFERNTAVFEQVDEDLWKE